MITYLAPFLKYIAVFFGAIIEGPILMIAMGFFLRLGYVSFLPLYIALLAGDLTGDIVWYFVGYYFAKPIIARYGKFLSITPEIFEKVKKLFERHDSKILFLSKITSGFGGALATLISAGAVRVPFKKYFIINGLGEFVWVSLLLTIGYAFGNIYSSIASGFKVAFIVSACVFVGGAVYGFFYFLRQRFIESK